jgi:hypothetical protein
MMRKLWIIWMVWILVLFVSKSFAENCECPGENFYCGVGIGTTPEEASEKARKDLAHSIYTFISSTTQKKVSKKQKKFKIEFREEDFSFTSAEFGNLEKKECPIDNGTRYKVVVYISKEKYKKFIEKRFSSIEKEINSLSLEELEKKRKYLPVLKRIADITEAKISEQKYNQLLEKLNKKIRERFLEKYQGKLDEAMSEVERMVADKQKSYQEKKDFINKKIKELNKLRPLFAKYGVESRLDKTVKKIQKKLKELEENTPGTISIVLKKGNGDIYIDGNRTNIITSTEEKVHTIVIRGRNGYETRSFKIRLKKGKIITKEIVLWRLDEAISNYSIGVGVDTNYWTGNLILIHYMKPFSLFKPFYGGCLGYSFERYGYTSGVVIGLKTYRRNPEELLLMVGNDLITFSIGSFLGYYGFNDKEDKHFWYVKPFISLEWHFNPLISLENIFYYQKVKWESEGIEPSCMGAIWSLNFYF